MNEVKSLTLNGTKYESFPNKTARSEIEELKERIETTTPGDSVPDDSGSTGQGVMNATAAALLIDILQSAAYVTNTTGKIAALQKALASGSVDTPDVPNLPDNPVVDDITVEDGVMTIISVGAPVTMVDGVLTIG